VSKDDFHTPIYHRTEHPLLLMDSGAYSLFNSGVQVDFDRYMAYVGAVKDEVLAVINLDIIPGSKGKRATKVETERACIVSFDRWLRLQATGALIMPVYHQTDDRAWLGRYLDYGAAFIGISPSDNMPDVLRKQWLLDVHDALDRSGIGLNRTVFTHLLGTFSPTGLMSLRGAAWSADASTIMQHSVRFRLMVPYAGGQITPSGAFDTIRVTYVGEDGDVAANKAIATGEVGEYLSAMGYGDDYEITGDRVLIDNVHALASANFQLAHRLNHATAIRSFIAGPDERVLQQIVEEEQYPYLLRTYAGTVETTGSTIHNFYQRKVKRPL